MTEIATLTTDLLALGTIAAQLLALVVVVALVLRPALLKRARPFILPFVFALSLGAAALTLVYSEIFGFAPCGLCWLQRVFLYPIPFIAGIALFAKDTGAWRYITGLAIPGLLIALYQHFIQMGGNDVLPCPAAPGAADCAQRLIFEFGYITFPLMAASLFALVIVLSLTLRKR
jgi:disulfide bond formation protein DsbB